jgi:hypothetical protein
MDFGISSKTLQVYQFLCYEGGRKSNGLTEALGKSKDSGRKQSHFFLRNGHEFFFRSEKRRSVGVISG